MVFSRLSAAPAHPLVNRTVWEQLVLSRLLKACMQMRYPRKQCGLMRCECQWSFAVRNLEPFFFSRIRRQLETAIAQPGFPLADAPLRPKSGPGGRGFRIHQGCGGGECNGSVIK